MQKIVHWIPLVYFINVMRLCGMILDSGGTILPEQAVYDVTYYALNLRIDPASQSISGFTIVEAKTLDALDVFVLHLNQNFTVDSIFYDSENLRMIPLYFRHLQGELWIDLPTTVEKNGSIRIEIYYHGQPKVSTDPPWDPGFVYKQTQFGRVFAGVVCEAEGGDLWWPCKDHPSDEPDSVSLNFRVPGGLSCISNGSLLGTTEHEDGTKTFHWFVSNPINNYNITFYLAPYWKINYSYQNVIGETFPVTIWVLPESYDVAVGHTQQFIEHMRFLELICGPYPFRAEKYGVVEAPYLGMEHQSAIAYGNHFQNKDGIDLVHFHELSHEWWGNMVTAKDWSDAWIHEGFATYMEALYVEQVNGKEAYHNFMETRSSWNNICPVAPREAMTMQSSFESGDLYNKAAWIIQTLRYYLGDTIFFNLLRRWCYPDPNMELVTTGEQCRLATTDDFLGLAEEITGRELGWFFEVYLRQRTIPKLKAVLNNQILTLEWEIENQILFPLPVEVRIGNTVVNATMESGHCELAVPAGVDPVIDPDRWILMQEPYISESINYTGWYSQEIDVDKRLNGIYFVNQDTGWVVGEGKSTIHKTTNGGDEWMQQSSGTWKWLNAVFFLNGDTGWAVGNYDVIIKTTDGGTNWMSQVSGTSECMFRDVYFIDASIGWAVGYGGDILKTTDGGSHWIGQESGTTEDLESLYFLSSDTGWVVGSMATILKTTDGGLHWVDRSIGSWHRLYSVHFLDSDTGFAVGGNGIIIRTNNGGVTWSEQITDMPIHFYSICFSDIRTGWVVGGNGSILKSANGGLNWEITNEGLGVDFRSVFFVDVNTGWIAGDHGILLKTATGGETSIERRPFLFPENLELLQNYPNPFNATTRIQFRIPESCFVTMKVYNLLGEKIETLVEGQRTAGKYELRWDAKSLLSGIYLCRLEVGGYMRTIKLVLQR